MEQVILLTYHDGCQLLLRSDYVNCGNVAGAEQPNEWDSSWINFFKEKRLMHQVNLTGNRSLIALGQSVADKLDVLFEGVEVKPSVLHGDLWSGNMASVEGAPAGALTYRNKSIGHMICTLLCTLQGIAKCEPVPCYILHF